MVSRLLANSGWRFLMISGALPALLVFFIRLFVPESKKWEHEKARGATSHWSNVDLDRRLDRLSRIDRDHLELVAGGNGPGAAAIITLLGVAAALWGFLFPVRRYLERAVSAGIARPATAADGDSPHAVRRRPRRRCAARHVGIDSMGAALGISARTRP